MDRAIVIKVIAIGVGVVYISFGAWAFLAPRSFFDATATFPPFNRHFIHDIGAFQIGLGSMLLLAWRMGALLAALVSNAAAASVHWLSHVIDRDLGGSGSDPITLALLAVALITAAVMAQDQPIGTRKAR